jgi:hypothetical protein
MVQCKRALPGHFSPVAALVRILPSVACIFALCACPPVAGGSGDSNSATATEILRALNVNEVDNPPTLTTTATTGETVTISDPDTWQPLKKSYTVFNPTAQVFLLGVPVYNSYSALWADSRENPPKTPISGSGTSSWANTSAKKSVAADLDGDGLVEWVVFYIPEVNGKALWMTVGRLENGSISFSSSKEVSGVSASPYLHSNFEVAPFVIKGVYRNIRYNYFQLSAADVDGDGKQEILFANYKQAIVLKVSKDGSSASVIDSKTYNNPISSFVGGDYDGDGKDEFVVCVQSEGFALYDSSFSSNFTNPEMSTSGFKDYSWSWSDVAAQACFGDFNGDNIDDLAIKVAGTFGWITRTYQVIGRSLEAKHTMSNTDSFSDSQSNIAGMPVAVDIDGDGRDELFMHPYLCSNVLNDKPQESLRISDLDNVEYLLDVYAGDVDGDIDGDVNGDDKGKEDLIYYSSVGDIGKLSSVGMTAAGTTWKDLENKRLFSYIPTASKDHVWFETCMAVGHFYDNSPRVQYVGHELQFSEPIVIAALASPPYYTDIAAVDASYSYTDWVTTFGTKTTQSSSNSAKVGFSIGASVELEQEASIFGIKLATFRASASFEVSTNCQWTTSHSISKSITYTCNGGEDRVIFTAVPIDVYSYKILASPESNDVGRVMTINIPRDYATYTVTREYFNAHNGELADIGATVFPHTLGQVKTYPTAAAKDSLLTTYGGYSIDAQPAGQASISNSGTALEIEVEKGQEKTFSVDLQSRFSIGGGVGGVVVSVEAGFNVGYEYTSSTSEGTSFGGTVGYLPTAYFNNPTYAYSSGLFVYPYEDPNMLQEYWVVNYWVE